MQQIAYDHRRLATMFAGSAAMAAFTAFLAWSIGSAVVLVLAFFFLLIGGAAAYALIVGRPALQFDERQVTINTLVSSTTLQWSQIRDVRIESLVVTMYGFIPAGRTEYIVFLVAGGMLGTRRVRVSAKLLDRSRSIADVCAGLGSVRLKTDPAAAGFGSAGAAAAPPPEASSGPFDPDAAIARYLARRGTETQAQERPQPQRPQFGRRGL